MNNIYVIFYFINIFATQIHSASLGTAANVYDVVTANFSKTCPVLSNNVLVNSTTKYLYNCKDISLINPPEHINTLNINKFYCIGTLVADMQLCNSLSKYNYKYLPKNFEELELQITGIQKIKPEVLCKYLKQVELFNDTKIIPTLSKTVTELKEKLGGSNCAKLCTDLLNEKITNELCSLTFYIHSHIVNITKAIAHQKSINVDQKETTSLLSAPAPAPAVNALNTKTNKDPTKHNAATGGQLPVGEDAKKKIMTVAGQSQSLNHNLPSQTAGPINSKEVTNTEKPLVDVPLSVNEVKPIPPLVSIQPTNPSDSNEKPTKQPLLTTLQPVVGKISGQPKAVDNPPINDQTPLGEEQPNQTKNTGDVINETPKEFKTNVNQNIGSDEKDYSTTSTESNVQKPNPDNINNDYSLDDEDDVEGDGLKMNDNDDPNPIVEKVQEDLMNSRADINPNIKQVVNDEVEDSNFFSYFMFISVMFIAGYVVYHNKQKIMALVLEGRRDRNSRRRPSTSSYRKLNSNLEEAVTSKCSGSASHVIY